jgi:hypothetical protein
VASASRRATAASASARTGKAWAEVGLDLGAASLGGGQRGGGAGGFLVEMLDAEAVAFEGGAQFGLAGAQRGKVGGGGSRWSSPRWRRRWRSRWRRSRSAQSARAAARISAGAGALDGEPLGLGGAAWPEMAR